GDRAERGPGEGECGGAKEIAAGQGSLWHAISRPGGTTNVRAPAAGLNNDSALQFFDYCQSAHGSRIGAAHVKGGPVIGRTNASPTLDRQCLIYRGDHSACCRAAAEGPA